MRYSIEQVRDWISARGGKCHSLQITNSKSKVAVECADGHKWSVMASNLRKGTWCPVCAKSRWYTEAKCRYIIEKLTGKTFSTTRKVLSGLELDGYNDVLKIAFEYQGKQHYEFVPNVNHSFDKFVALRAHDREKVERCRQKRIKLIIIPYWETSADRNLVEFIQRKLNGYSLNALSLPLDEFYKLHSPLNQIRRIAEERGGKCLSTEYVSDRKKLQFVCKEGHIWSTTAKQIKKGAWCHICGGGYLKDLSDLKEIARDKGGECLSKAYNGTVSKLRFRCEHGHEWDASATSIRSGSWCPHCVGRYKGGSDVYRIAKSKGGECLSGEYKNARTPMKFRCRVGHEWFARPTNIRSGTWCSKCNRGRRHASYNKPESEQSR